MTETNEVARPIPEHEASDVDAPPKGELMYILVFQLQLCIYWFILMHVSLPRLSHPIQSLNNFSVRLMCLQNPKMTVLIQPTTDRTNRLNQHQLNREGPRSKSNRKGWTRPYVRILQHIHMWKHSILEAQYIGIVHIGIGKATRSQNMTIGNKVEAIIGHV